ncbi:unnamed protein product [Acanthoscelides obtectus]|uniref:Uncharacterized protein n=1 Tax=Acanthoscelides obtectus TaxID=200917 RepID=A0A9P0LQ48_ACAOB|nr:unnamed protein product [Acanthoscelides obtectus]CAK1646490.1 Zinc finger BED domain-containing protein 5 [Acanthoscelides obtectus]
MELSYLVDIFEKLNILHLQRQGANTHILDTSDKVNAFCRKLELRSRNLKQTNLEMFANIEEQHMKVVFVAIENHLAVLKKNFKKYFLFDDKSILSYEWVRNPFQITSEGLSTAEEEIFIDLTANAEIKNQSVLKFQYRKWFSAISLLPLHYPSASIIWTFSETKQRYEIGSKNCEQALADERDCQYGKLLLHSGLDNSIWLRGFGFLVGITGKLNELNLQLQGKRRRTGRNDF